MKAMISKWFGAEKRAQHHSQSHISYVVEDIRENQQRALIVWIANRLAQKLKMDLVFDFHISKSEHSDTNMSEEAKGLMNMASSLVSWVRDAEDVYMKTKALNLSEQKHRALLEIYEEKKHDLEHYAVSPDQKKEAETSAGTDGIWKIYREVIYAATQGKFHLISQQELSRNIKGNVLCETDIRERADIPKAREIAKQRFIDIGIPHAFMVSHLLVISEAITNVLKHAESGKISIFDTGERIQVMVSDQGPGFPLDILPKTTLMAGYSTKKSLGQGFTLMMKMAEQVQLCTTPEGSTILLILTKGTVQG